MLCCASTINISFVPNVMLDWSNLGFFAIDNVLPTDFQLDIVTLIQNVQVGGKIACMLFCHKEISKAVFYYLQLSVLHGYKPVDISMDSSDLKFEFMLQCDGDYHVTAQLYGKYAPGCPLTLPVASSASLGLLQLGLVPHDNRDGQAGTELCQAQLKLASSLFCFRLAQPTELELD